MEEKREKMVERKYVEAELSKLVEFTLRLEDELNSCVRYE